MGGKSLANTTPNTGVFHSATAKVNSDGTIAWLQGFQGNGAMQDNGINFIFDHSGNPFFYGDFEGIQLLAPDRTLTNTDPSGTTSDAYAGKYKSDGSIDWFDTFLSNRNDQVFLQFDPSGNLYVTGRFVGATMTTGGKTLTNADNSGNTADTFIEKINPIDGSLLWLTTFASDSWDDVFPVFDSSGNLYARGDFQGTKLAVGGTNVLTNSSPGSTDAFVARLDPTTGHLSWITGFSSNKSDFISMITDSSGNIYAFGSFMGPTLTAGGKTLTNADNSGNTSDGFVANLNSANGALVWLTGVSSTKQDLVSLTSDSLGDVYLSGSFFGPTLSVGGKTLTNADASGNTADNFLGRLNVNNGMITWLVSFSGPGSSGSFFGSFPAVTDSSGNVYVSSEFSGTTLTVAGQTLTNADSSGNTTDAFIAKFNSDGILKWLSSFSGDGNEFVNLDTDASGNLKSDGLFFNGTFMSSKLLADGQTFANADSSGKTQDAFVGRLNPTDGTFMWFLPISSVGDDYASLVPDTAGNLYLSGTFKGPTLTLQGQTLTNADASGKTRDAFLTRIVP